MTDKQTKEVGYNMAKAFFKTLPKDFKGSILDKLNDYLCGDKILKEQNVDIGLIMSGAIDAYHEFIEEKGKRVAVLATHEKQGEENAT